MSCAVDSFQRNFTTCCTSTTMSMGVLSWHNIPVNFIFHMNLNGCQTRTSEWEWADMRFYVCKRPTNVSVKHDAIIKTMCLTLLPLVQNFTTFYTSTTTIKVLTMSMGVLSWHNIPVNFIFHMNLNGCQIWTSEWELADMWFYVCKT